MKISPTDTFEASRSGTGPRSFRVLHNGEPLRDAATGRPQKFTETAMHDKVEELHAAALALPQPTRPATDTKPAPNGSVLKTRRLDGLTAEQAAARYKAPPRLALVHRTRGRLHLAMTGTGTTAVVQLRDGQAVGITVALAGKELYSGTLEALHETADRSRHALSLAPWRMLGADTVARYLGQADA